jgi:pimeloyl-ACP methyl ester carboxylesterase
MTPGDTVPDKVDATALTHLLPHAQFLQVKQAGHAMMYENAVAMARPIDSFARG